MWNLIVQKIEAAQPLTAAECLYLLTDAPLLELGQMALCQRERILGSREVTFTLAGSLVAARLPGQMVARLPDSIQQPESIAQCLELTRHLQVQRPEFSAFFPWPGRFDLSDSPRSHHLYPRIIAASRLYFGASIPHIQAGWFSHANKAGELALYFGADTFGSVSVDSAEVADLIRAAGFVPREVLLTVDAKNREVASV